MKSKYVQIIIIYVEALFNMKLLKLNFSATEIFNLHFRILI